MTTHCTMPITHKLCNIVASLCAGLQENSSCTICLLHNQSVVHTNRVSCSIEGGSTVGVSHYCAAALPSEMVGNLHGNACPISRQIHTGLSCISTCDTHLTTSSLCSRNGSHKLVSVHHIAQVEKALEVCALHAKVCQGNRLHPGPATTSGRQSG